MERPLLLFILILLAPCTLGVYQEKLDFLYDMGKAVLPQAVYISYKHYGFVYENATFDKHNKSLSLYTKMFNTGKMYKNTSANTAPFAELAKLAKIQIKDIQKTLGQIKSLAEEEFAYGDLPAPGTIVEGEHFNRSVWLQNTKFDDIKTIAAVLDQSKNYNPSSPIEQDGKSQQYLEHLTNFMNELDKYHLEIKLLLELIITLRKKEITEDVTELLKHHLNQEEEYSIKIKPVMYYSKDYNIAFTIEVHTFHTLKEVTEYKSIPFFGHKVEGQYYSYGFNNRLFQLECQGDICHESRNDCTESLYHSDLKGILLNCTFVPDKTPFEVTPKGLFVYSAPSAEIIKLMQEHNLNATQRPMLAQFTGCFSLKQYNLNISGCFKMDEKLITPKYDTAAIDTFFHPDFIFQILSYIQDWPLFAVLTIIPTLSITVLLIIKTIIKKIFECLWQCFKPRYRPIPEFEMHPRRPRRSQRHRRRSGSQHHRQIRLISSKPDLVLTRRVKIACTRCKNWTTTTIPHCSDKFIAQYVHLEPTAVERLNRPSPISDPLQGSTIRTTCRSCRYHVTTGPQTTALAKGIRLYLLPTFGTISKNFIRDTFKKVSDHSVQGIKNMKQTMMNYEKSARYYAQRAGDDDENLDPLEKARRQAHRRQREIEIDHQAVGVRLEIFDKVMGKTPRKRVGMMQASTSSTKKSKTELPEWAKTQESGQDVLNALRTPLIPPASPSPHSSSSDSEISDYIHDVSTPTIRDVIKKMFGRRTVKEELSSLQTKEEDSDGSTDSLEAEPSKTPTEARDIVQENPEDSDQSSSPEPSAPLLESEGSSPKLLDLKTAFDRQDFIRDAFQSLALKLPAEVKTPAVSQGSSQSTSGFNTVVRHCESGLRKRPSPLPDDRKGRAIILSTLQKSTSGPGISPHHPLFHKYSKAKVAPQAPETTEKQRVEGRRRFTLLQALTPMAVYDALITNDREYQFMHPQRCEYHTYYYGNGIRPNAYCIYCRSSHPHSFNMTQLATMPALERCKNNLHSWVCNNDRNYSLMCFYCKTVDPADCDFGELKDDELNKVFEEPKKNI